MTTYSWTLLPGSSGVGNTNLIVFGLTQPDGRTPNTTAAPVFTYYGARSGTQEMAPPVLYHRGFGVYVAEVPANDAAVGVVWMVTTGATPARVAGAVSTVNDPLVAFLVEETSGALWTGTTPTFSVYARADGTPWGSTPTLLKGDRIGVYAFTGTSDQATAGTIFQVDTAATALPPHVVGKLTGNQPVTFTATQVDWRTVRLLLSRSVEDGSRIKNFLNYSVVPTDTQIVSPAITKVTVVSDTAVDLTLSVELATGLYAVTVLANTWYTADNYATNDTLPVALNAVGDAPVLVSAFAPTLNHVRVMYSKRMRRSSPSATGDALNPAYYVIPGATVSSVTAVDDQTFDLALAVPLLIGTSYSLTVSTARDLIGTPVTTTTVSLPYGSVALETQSPGDVIGNSVLVPAEWRLRTPFPFPTLEYFRKFLLSNVSASEFIGAKGRCILLFTQDTDVRAIFTTLFGVDLNTPRPEIVERSAPLDVFNAVDPSLARLVAPALRELKLAGVPEAFIALLHTRLNSESYLERVSAYAAVVLLAAAVIA